MVTDLTWLFYHLWPPLCCVSLPNITFSKRHESPSRYVGTARKFKGESVVVAISSSRMKVSCGCGFSYGKHFQTGYGMFSLWFNELWPNHGQTNDGIIYRVYRGVAKCGVWYSAEWTEMQEISCKSFQKSDWSYGNETKMSPINHTQFIWLNCERSSQSYDNCNVLPYGSCYH